MHTYQGQYHVMAFCRRANTTGSDKFQARADIYHLSDKTPTHCIRNHEHFPTRDGAKIEALKAGVSWVCRRGR